MIQSSTDAEDQSKEIWPCGWSKLGVFGKTLCFSFHFLLYLLTGFLDGPMMATSSSQGRLLPPCLAGRINFFALTFWEILRFFPEWVVSNLDSPELSESELCLKLCSWERGIFFFSFWFTSSAFQVAQW